jgi:hypothetical protein
MINYGKIDLYIKNKNLFNLYFITVILVDNIL